MKYKMTFKLLWLANAASALFSIAACEAQQPQLEEASVTGELASRSEIETSFTVSSTLATLSAKGILKSLLRNVGEIFPAIPGMCSPSSAGLLRRFYIKHVLSLELSLDNLSDEIGVSEVEERMGGWAMLYSSKSIAVEPVTH